MAKIEELQEVAIEKLRPYERNARIHSKEQIEKLAKSISEFGFVNPVLIDSEFNVIAGHGRIEAAKLLGLRTVPCAYVKGMNDDQRRAYILADNRLAEMASWDMSLVNVELGDLKDFGLMDIDVTGFELPKNWFESHERNDTSRQDGNDEYNEFLEKFEPKKTTDDCYTPDAIYDVVCDYVENISSYKREDFIRPFYPGGDYENENYDGKVVVDNPPFSVLAQIIDFYIDRNIKFFLFAPYLTIFSTLRNRKATAIVIDGDVIYENGANVNTSFITNFDELKDIVVMSAPDLNAKIEAANYQNQNKEKLLKRVFEYPPEVITSRHIGFCSAHGQEIKIARSDSCFIRGLDADGGTQIFGGGFLLSEKAAAEKAAAEKADNTVRLELSDREIEIVKLLGGKSNG